MRALNVHARFHSSGATRLPSHEFALETRIHITQKFSEMGGCSLHVAQPTGLQVRVVRVVRGSYGVRVQPSKTAIARVHLQINEGVDKLNNSSAAGPANPFKGKR